MRADLESLELRLEEEKERSAQLLLQVIDPPPPPRHAHKRTRVSKMSNGMQT